MPFPSVKTKPQWGFLSGHQGWPQGRANSTDRWPKWPWASSAQLIWQSQVCREGRRLHLPCQLPLPPALHTQELSHLWPGQAHDSSVLLPLLSPSFCFYQADSNKLQAITGKTPQSVLGNAFHCLTLSYSINYVKLLLPAVTKGGWIPCLWALQLRLHQRHTHGSH